ncbi:MAG: hypothetical protein J6A77_05195 [Lachnospiraceae bacterium]|nr:hypothetical protein [Lachnospiraceae bacterium]
MEQKDERTLDLLVTAKWVDEDGNEYEQNMQIADIARQNSVSIELKTVESRFLLEEPEAEERFVFWKPTAVECLKQNICIERCNEILTRKKVQTHYHCMMQIYWDYYEYQHKDDLFLTKE